MIFSWGPVPCGIDPIQCSSAQAHPAGRMIGIEFDSATCEFPRAKSDAGAPHGRAVSGTSAAFQRISPTLPEPTERLEQQQLHVDVLVLLWRSDGCARDLRATRLMTQLPTSVGSLLRQAPTCQFSKRPTTIPHLPPDRIAFLSLRVPLAPRGSRERGDSELPPRTLRSLRREPQCPESYRAPDPLYTLAQPLRV